jgi:hypothetical protein
MRAGCDVDQVILLISFERIPNGEIVQGAIDALEIPGVIEMRFPDADFCFGTDRGNVLTDELAKLAEFRLEQKFEAIDQQIFVLAN